jgi:hypothetical protein
MKRSSTVFLQVVVVLIAILALGWMLWEPHLEGRNVHATVFQIYFNDPFLAYIYAASIAFYAALYQAFKLLGYIGRNEVFSQRSVSALRTIKFCAMALVGFIGGALAIILLIVRSDDDSAGAVAVGLFLAFVCAVVATAAAVFEKTLQSAVELKSENDLTV